MTWRQAPQAIAIAATLACVALLATTPSREPDLFMYLAIARRMLAAGAIPRIDPFLHALPGAPLLASHEWLGMLGYYLLHLGGMAAVGTAVTAVVLAIFAMPLGLIARARHARGSEWALAVTALASYAASMRYLPRTALLGDLLAAATLLLLVRARAGATRALWALPPLFLIWVNVHPTFPIGLGAVALAAALEPRRSRPWLAVAPACVLACLVNPDGLRGLLFPFGFGGDEAVDLKSRVLEWYPLLHPAIRQILEVRVFIVEVLAFAGLLIWRRDRRPWFEAVWSLVLVGLAVWAVRFVSVAAVGLALLAAGIVSAEPQAPSPFSTRVHGVVALAAAALAAALLAGWNPGRAKPHVVGLGLDHAFYSPAAIDWLTAQGPLPGAVFNSWEQGGYLAWRWDGDPKIFIHGFMTDTAFLDESYTTIAASRDKFEAVVERFQLGVFVLGRALPHRRLIELLESHPGWQRVRTDDAVLIYFKVSATYNSP
jgi:hypothetical protein